MSSVVRVLLLELYGLSTHLEHLVQVNDIALAEQKFG